MKQGRNTGNRTLRYAFVLALGLSGCSVIESGLKRSEPTFTIAVIPDTQNYVDYKHQENEDFAIDAAELFLDQMRDIASRTTTRGGDVAFVVSVGDVWQHQTKEIDEEHRRRGLGAIENPILGTYIAATEKTLSVEIPKAIEGYRILAATGVPFGVAPGNHDYDAMWSVAGYRPNLRKHPSKMTMTPEDLGMLHVGGLDNFRAVFGADSVFFKDQPWYIDSFAGGANSAQSFSAGGYTFLHIALQMQAPDEALAWADSVIAENFGVPTIVTTHDYLAADGERRANPIIDLDRVDPDRHNNAEELWSKFIRNHDQIFLVLCGHHHGQGLRVEANAFGNPVHQILADYQDRGQIGIDAGQAPNRLTGKPVGIGDGWYRLMHFDLNRKSPSITVRTYSSYYGKHSRDVERYAAWYKQHEKPDLSDASFHAADDYRIELENFHPRFAKTSETKQSLGSHY